MRHGRSAKPCPGSNLRTITLQLRTRSIWIEIAARSHENMTSQLNTPMAAFPVVNSTFSVTSGCLCFGTLHNIWAGASSVALPGFPTVRPNKAGVQRLEFNIAAQNGTWNVYQLKDARDRNKTNGWFASHSSLDPGDEIRKIVDLTVNYFGDDVQNLFNNYRTEAEGVFVINQHDWNRHDRRFWEEFGEEPKSTGGYITPAGLVDCAQAKGQVQEWKKTPLRERGASESGAWMAIEDSYRAFGRFGFDESRSTARSFLYYATIGHTHSAAFVGFEEPIRDYNEEKTIERQLREGYDYNGILELHERILFGSNEPGNQAKRPVRRRPLPDSLLLGPYNESEHIFRPGDIEPLRRFWRESDYAQRYVPHLDIDLDTYDNKTWRGFIDPWKEPVYDLLNEMALSYLEAFILPLARQRSPPAVITTLLEGEPYRENRREVQGPYLLPDHITYETIPNFDAGAVEARVKRFLVYRSGNDPNAFKNKYITKVTWVLSYILSVLLGSADDIAKRKHRNAILPCDIRGAFYSNYIGNGVFSLLGYSKVVWKGRE